MPASLLLTFFLISVCANTYILFIIWRSFFPLFFWFFQIFSYGSMALKHILIALNCSMNNSFILLDCPTGLFPLQTEILLALCTMHNGSTSQVCTMAWRYHLSNRPTRDINLLEASFWLETWEGGRSLLSLIRQYLLFTEFLLFQKLPVMLSYTLQWHHGISLLEVSYANHVRNSCFRHIYFLEEPTSFDLSLHLKQSAWIYKLKIS